MSSGSRSGGRMVHQDYIARIRFSNALPPPPNPPKLLEIAKTGLASGQYTSPGFAWRLAREQPLNIEADGELGMPLNLVGMPGVFDGDEGSIQAPAQQPPVHARDRPLLRPMAALGKPKVAESNVSFLRRTEYISSSTSTAKRPDAASHTPALMPRQLVRPPRPAPQAAASTPQAIKRKLDSGFDAAAAEVKDPKRIRHPTKRQARCVDVLPLVPDLDGFPDSGAYVTVKFLTNPVSSSASYDERLLSAMLRPIERTATEEAAYEAALAAHEQDPAAYPKPQNLMNYDFYLAHTLAAAQAFRQKFDVADAQRDNDHLYTHRASGRGFFQFNRVRAYETVHETELDHPTKYDDEIILSFDHAAVYYYPVMQRSSIRPQRTKNIARVTGFTQEGDDQIVDQLDITVEEPTDEMRQVIYAYKEQPLGLHQAGEADDDGDAEHQRQRQKQQQQAEATDATADSETVANNHDDAPDQDDERQASKTPEDDQDAEGEEDID
ncbi:hypothetical protein CDD82_3839 [Ophiocordyceps australis]|uniref:Uncharacterized protein n=1 Tax=Ophiocordyceps australis TaxID=1399860 RepID=A0A2C5ZPM9_9HYPO|nr:hypothetical protein CDD82_3839 [Ophiocordyceps australis]